MIDFVTGFCSVMYALNAESRKCSYFDMVMIEWRMRKYNANKKGQINNHFDSRPIWKLFIYLELIELRSYDENISGFIRNNYQKTFDKKPQ